MKFKQWLATIQFKVFMGAILVAGLLLSLSFILQTLHLFLLQYYSNAYTLEFIIFGSAIVLCSLGLYFLLKSPKRDIAFEKDEDLSILLSVDMRILAFKFVEGFIDGLVKPRNSSFQVTTAQKERARLKQA